MANVVTGNPYVIDTASSTAIDTAPMRRLRRVRWVGATTAAHTAVIQDGAGTVKWAGHAIANATDDSPVDVSMTGLLVPTLASGKLYLYWD